MPQLVPTMKKSPSSKTPVTKSRPAPRKTNPSLNSSASDFTELRSLQEIKELIEFASEKQFDVIELGRGDFRLCLRRGGAPAEIPNQPTVPILPLVSAPAASSFATTLTPVTTAETVAATPAPVAEDLHIITSPIVGTFYRSSSPTTEPFIKNGELIEAGQTLCIVEAMKLMNEIQSDVSGTVIKLFVESGQPVEYGQPLFGIKL